MIKTEIRSSSIHGTGVFARQNIKAGDVVLKIDDTRIVDDSHPLCPEKGESEDHCDYLPNGTTVLMQEPERYINHCCHPNVFIYSVKNIRFVLARRDISAGEEIAYDYAINAVDGDVWTPRCGLTNCRGTHKCDFFALPAETQRGYLTILDPSFAQMHEDRILALLETS